MPDVARQTYPFTLPDLPYPYAALEPHLDQATMRVHHDKHHKTYVDKLNEAVASESALHGLTLVELLRDLDKLPEGVRGAVRNNGGGHYNHDLFWNSLSAAGTAGAPREPRGELAKVMTAQFGSFGKFREKFTDVAAKHFASGWTALVVEHAAGQLGIVDLKDHDVPDLARTTPLMILDVWEHAYYLKFQNRRPEFLEAFWNVIDWDKTAERFQASRTATPV